MLSNLSITLLKLFSERTTLSLKDLGAIYNVNPENFCESIAYLRRCNYLEILPSYVMLHNNDFTLDAPFRITYEGKSVLEENLKAGRQNKFNEFRAWMTLGIAILAFILSIFSLYLQYR